MKFTCGTIIIIIIMSHVCLNCYWVKWDVRCEMTHEDNINGVRRNYILGHPTVCVCQSAKKRDENWFDLEAIAISMQSEPYSLNSQSNNAIVTHDIITVIIIIFFVSGSHHCCCCANEIGLFLWVNCKKVKGNYVKNDDWSMHVKVITTKSMGIF